MFAARNCCFGLDAGPRGRVSLTQGEASTFTVLREVLAFRDLIVYIKDDSYNSWSLVTSVSFHAVFTGRIELNRLTISKSSVNHMVVRTEFWYEEFII